MLLYTLYSCGSNTLFLPHLWPSSSWAAAGSLSVLAEREVEAVVHAGREEARAGHGEPSFPSLAVLSAPPKKIQL